jgi:hypothetical protein
VSGRIYINLDSDADSLVVEGPVTNYNIDTSEESNVDIYQVICRNAKKDGILLKEGSASAPDTFNISGTYVYDPGFDGICVGHRPDPPAAGGVAPTQDVGYTPENVTIDQCTIWRYGRERTVRIPLSGTDWYNGYINPMRGVSIVQGEHNPSGGDSNLVDRTIVWGDKAAINYSAARNGIVIKHGTDAKVTRCLIQDADHAIAATGAIDSTGKLGRIVITRNRVSGTGDDGIFVLGMSAGGATLKASVIAYNILENCGDNAIDNMNSIWTEIYNNVFINNVNEEITIWGGATWNGKLVASNAFVLNNVFINWGREGWVSNAPGKRRGAAIGFGNEGFETLASESVGRSVVKGNLFYHDDEDSDVYDYPFHVAEVQYTFAEMVSEYGLDASNVVLDPKILDKSSDEKDTRPGNDSPLLNTGIDLSSFTDEITLHENDDIVFWTPYAFNNGAVKDGLVHYDSVWPLLVTTVTQGSQLRSTGQWNKGPWATSPYRIKDTTASFPTDKSLIGLLAYVVNPTSKSIWKGIITAVTSSEIQVEEWLPAFNATGLPYGADLTYGIGHILVYDKTGIFVPFSDQQDGNILKFEMFQKKLSLYPDVYYKLSFDDGEGAQVPGKMDRSGTRLSAPQGSGYGRSVQIEHAALVKSRLAIKSLAVTIEWADGRTDG